MNVSDYWPMAREYSVWNTAVAALQFWTADLKVHVLSSGIEQVNSASFYLTYTHLLHQQSDEVLFNHIVTTHNATFESKLTLEDEGYESGSEILTYPSLSEEPPKFTMFLVMRISPLIQQHHTSLVPASHITNLYDID